jgi:hypothetical protein
MSWERSALASEPKVLYHESETCPQSWTTKPSCHALGFWRLAFTTGNTLGLSQPHHSNLRGAIPNLGFAQGLCRLMTECADIEAELPNSTRFTFGSTATDAVQTLFEEEII